MKIINHNNCGFKDSQNSKIYFKAAPGNFINPNVLNQRNCLKNSLIPVLEKGTGFADGISKAISKTFPELNFKIGNISDLVYSNIQKEKPFVFTRTSFKKEKPLTFLYLDFPEIIKISANKARKQYEGLIESITDAVALANEPHFISKIIDRCTELTSPINNITIESVKSVLENCLKTFEINIDNEVLNKKEAENQFELAKNSQNPITIVGYNNNNVETKLCLIMDKDTPDVKKAISHEFTHTLNANSIWVNDIFNDLNNLDDVPRVQINYGAIFQKIYEADSKFLNENVSIRGKVYENQLKNMLEQVNSIRDKKLVFEQILANVSDEAFAYSQTPNLFNEYKNETQDMEQIPIGWFFVDFYDFLLAMRNNNELYLSL